jgi:hypothetical protein
MNNLFTFSFSTVLEVYTEGVGNYAYYTDKIGNFLNIAAKQQKFSITSQAMPISKIEKYKKELQSLGFSIETVSLENNGWAGKLEKYYSCTLIASK